MWLEGKKIAVIGAGIGGLAAATALAQRGAQVSVFERASALREVGAGIQVAPNGVAVLEALGLRSAAEEVAETPQAVILRDGLRGRRVARLPLGSDVVARFGRPYWQFHRADLLNVLERGAREAGVRIVLNAEIDPRKDLTIYPDGFHVDASIAADGIKSDIRAARFSGQPARFTGHVAWRALVDANRLPADFLSDGASLAMGPGRHLVAYRLRGGSLINVVAVEERAHWTAEGWNMPDDPEHLRAAFAGWDDQTQALLEAVEESYLWGLFFHPPLDTWVHGKVALLGDACHPMLPYLAHGATSALEDAWVLAAELGVASDLESGLQAYESRRKRRATDVQEAAARNGRLYHLKPGARDLVYGAMWAAGRVSPGFFLRRFDWLYGADVVSAQATQ